jgi:2-methylcitrate dehydratase PrpD
VPVGRNSVQGENGMTTTNHTTAIEVLSANILESSFEKLDKVTVKNAKFRIIDVLGCAIGGADAPGNEPLVKLAKDWGG